MRSHFLPKSFDVNPSVALIAGKGAYPLRSFEAMRKAEVSIKLIALDEETDPALWDCVASEDRVRIQIGQLGGLLKHLKRFGVAHALMVGQITPGRLFRDFRPDLKALSLFMKLKKRSAATLFGTVAAQIEALGIGVLDARAFLDEDIAGEGPLTRKLLSVKPEHLEHGIEIARHIADKDIGQGVVVSEGSVLAVEAFEGTNAMLRRAGSFKAKNALFVKTTQRDQDYRFDVPVFGNQTLDVLQEAGIHNVALKSKACLILNQASVLAQANARGTAVYGF